MAATAMRRERHGWVLELMSDESFADDLGMVGEWVAPRTGPLKRTHGQKEAYVLRRLLVAMRVGGALAFPSIICAVPEDEQRDRQLPDFTVRSSDSLLLGLEVTEAGEEDYQRWLTMNEQDAEVILPERLHASTTRIVEEFRRAILNKLASFDSGRYRGVGTIDLAVYDNSSWGGFLDKSEIVARLGRFNDLMGRFRRVHLVFESDVILDVFGKAQGVDLRSRYETDYTAWLADQVERLRRLDVASLDVADIAEELADLGKNERHAVIGHLTNLLLHLLKWEFQPGMRSHGWEASIRAARRRLYKLLIASPSLRGHARKSIDDAFMDARDGAIVQTGLAPETFPETCPYTYQQILDSEFLPGGGGRT